VQPIDTPHGPRIRVEPGDSPWTIARAYVGAPLRWPELVKANPDKALSPSGNFVSLVPGEELFVPVSWLEYRKEHPFSSAVLKSPLATTEPPTVKAAGALDTVTPRLWAEALLRRLGAPVTDDNIAAIVAWEANEGGHWINAARYNPLNTTRQYGDSHAWGGRVPIQVYTSWTEGLEATALTIEQKNMSAIRDAILSDSSPSETLSAVKTSPWGTTAINPDAWQTFQAYGSRPDPLGSSDYELASYTQGGKGGGGLGTLAIVGIGFLGAWYLRQKGIV
jgi:hypothetical protein